MRCYSNRAAATAGRDCSLRDGQSWCPRKGGTWRGAGDARANARTGQLGLGDVLVSAPAAISNEERLRGRASAFDDENVLLRDRVVGWLVLIYAHVWIHFGRQPVELPSPLAQPTCNQQDGRRPRSPEQRQRGCFRGCRWGAADPSARSNSCDSGSPGRARASGIATPPAPSASDDHGRDEREIAADDQRAMGPTQPATGIRARQRHGGQTEIPASNECSLS